MSEFAKVTCRFMEPKGYYIFGGLIEMVKTIWLGRTIKLSKEAAEQLDVVSNETGKLAELSRRSWDVLTTSCYRRNMAGSALVGATSVVGVIGLTKLVRKIRKNRKDKKEPESE